MEELENINKHQSQAEYQDRFWKELMDKSENKTDELHKPQDEHLPLPEKTEFNQAKSKRSAKRRNPFYKSRGADITNKDSNVHVDIPIGYSVPKYKLASIYNYIKPLIPLTMKLKFFMSRKDAQIYATNAEKYLMESLGDFIIAFDHQDERPHHYQALEGNLHRYTEIIDTINGERLMRNCNQALRNTTNMDLPKDSETLLLRIYEYIGKIDEDMSKWRPVAMRDKSSQENPLKNGGRQTKN